MRSGFLFAALAVTGCAYLRSSVAEPAGTAAPAKVAVASLTSGSGVVKAMHDLYGGKYLKTMSFLQNNTAYTIAGQEQHSQWYEHMEVPGKLRIAFLPATQRSGLVQVDDNVASFDNGIRVDIRPSVNPLLLLTADVYAAPVATIMRGLDFQPDVGRCRPNASLAVHPTREERQSSHNQRLPCPELQGHSGLSYSNRVPRDSQRPARMA